MPHELPALTLIDFWPVLQRLALAGLGAGTFVHLVCMANFMPPGRSPAVVWVPVAAGAGSAVIIVHSVYLNDLPLALWASAMAAACMLALQLVLWLRGYHVCAHLSRTDTPARPHQSHPLTPQSALSAGDPS